MVSQPLASRDEAVSEAKFQIEKGYRALHTQVVIIESSFESSETIAYTAVER